MEEDENSLGEGGLGGPTRSRLSTLCGHPLLPRICFSGAGGGKSLWGGSGWGWAVAGAGGSMTQGFLGSPSAVSSSTFKALF